MQDKKEYYQQNKDKLLLRSKERYQLKKDEVKTHLNQYYKTKKGRLAVSFNNLRQKAKRKGIEVSVSLDYVRSIATDTCPVFGIKFDWEDWGEKDGIAKDTSPSLDRIDPTKGYIEGNIIFISTKANRIKNNASVEELKAVVQWLEKEQNDRSNA
jgi:hypothetical protein